MYRALKFCIPSGVSTKLANLPIQEVRKDCKKNEVKNKRPRRKGS